NLARWVRPRAPFRQNPLRRLPHELADATDSGLEELSTIIADVESGQRGLPILLKQYLRLGGKLVAFNVDRKFANALDGLIGVDLTRTDTRILERYMGKGGARSFLDYWGRPALSA